MIRNSLFPTVMERFLGAATAHADLPKPPVFSRQVDRPNTDQAKMLRSLGVFTVNAYVKVVGVSIRQGRDHIARLLNDGVVESAGFEVRQGSGVSSRPMQVFRLKRKEG